MPYERIYLSGLLSDDFGGTAAGSAIDVGYEFTHFDAGVQIDTISGGLFGWESKRVDR